MFTGIIEERGEIVAVEPAGDGLRVTVRGPRAVSDAAQGDSIAVSGVCLTVVDQGDDWFAADVMHQTLAVTSLGEIGPGTPVNLERALAAHTRLGGHIVQGHVDGTGTVREVRPGAQWRVIRISLPADLAPLVVDKGSIAVDGVSLTVYDIRPDRFTVSLIPTTLASTNLGSAAVGTVVNLEADILGKYVVAHLDHLEPGAAQEVTRG